MLLPQLSSSSLSPTGQPIENRSYPSSAARFSEDTRPRRSAVNTALLQWPNSASGPADAAAPPWRRRDVLVSSDRSAAAGVVAAARAGVAGAGALHHPAALVARGAEVEAAEPSETTARKAQQDVRSTRCRAESKSTTTSSRSTS